MIQHYNTTTLCGVRFEQAKYITIHVSKYSHFEFTKKIIKNVFSFQAINSVSLINVFTLQKRRELTLQKWYAIYNTFIIVITSHANEVNCGNSVK